jgi:hypothetical protein
MAAGTVAGTMGFWDAEFYAKDVRFNINGWELTGEVRPVQPGEFCISDIGRPDPEIHQVWLAERRCNVPYRIVKRRAA